MKAQHTSGPWEFVLEDDGCSSGVTFIIRMDSHLGGENGWEPQHRIEYEVPSEEESPEQFAEARANVRLIAAAPETYDALKELYAMVKGECPSLLNEDSGGDARLAIAIEKALAKAEGRQA